ncbi:unnamed protein product [Phytophthora fragariaefolia]|uniref:Unnamed protein product n=1 Tax=Phytophthora fragariaefolia TaxID=1490495 RepID=A0A9W6WV84_9STRA|nr:unnamed protein product [Phytophthora fragariaefolia]
MKRGGKEKERVTVTLLGDSEVNKYTPYVVFKVRPFRKPETQLDNLRLCTTSDILLTTYLFSSFVGWWDSELTVEWLEFQFGSRENCLEHVLLLLDNFSGQWTSEVVEYANAINATLMKVPPNTTTVSQQVDAMLNGPFKIKLHNGWILNLRERLASRVSGVPFILKPPCRDQLCG